MSARGLGVDSCLGTFLLLGCSAFACACTRTGRELIIHGGSPFYFLVLKFFVMS